MLDGCSVSTTWELRSVLQDERGLSGDSGVRCKSNTWHRKLSTPPVPNLVLRLRIHEVPGGCERWRLGCVVFVNQQNAGYESGLSSLTSWTKKSQKLEYIYPLFPPTLPFSFPPELHTPPASWTISRSHDWNEITLLVSKHICWLTQLCTFPLGFFQLFAIVS